MTEWRTPIPAAEDGDIPSLNPSPGEGRPRRDLNFYVYMRRRTRGRPDDGWIHPKPGWPTERSKWQDQGWEPLDRYGRVETDKNSWVDANGVPFNFHREHYRVLFQRGGAKELPASQVIAYGWHLRPPYREIVFPQLEGLDIPEFPCPECEHLPFSDALHLRDHLMIRHDYTRTELVTYAKDADISFERRRVSAREEPEPEPAPILDLTPTEVRCEVCGWEPNPTKTRPEQALRMHLRSHESSDEAVVLADAPPVATTTA